jgi:hypothetical protein
MIVVERNNHGHTVGFVLEEAGYPRLYRHLEYDVAGQAFLKLGFPTTPVTKTYVVDALAEVIRRDALPASEWRFWAEALVFVRDPAGKCGAMPGRHDDRVMSKAIGVYVVTLGAKAWGGTGLVEGADGANMPVGKVQGAAAAVGQSYPVPQAQATFAPYVPQGRPDAVDPPHTLDEARSLPLGPGFPGAPPSGQAPGADTVFAQLRAARQEVAEQPTCGNCAHLTDRNGIKVCGAQGFTVRPGDPSCGLWEPVDDGYNEGPDPWTVNIGGMP